jgi:acyl dehydratase
MVSPLSKSKNLNFDEIAVGQKSSFQVQITKEIIEKFAELSGDYNPLHMDEIYAQNSQFKQRITHGMLLGTFFSQLVGMHIPGEKCLYLSQNLNFHNPCYISDIVSIDGIVKEKSNSTKILEIETTIHNQKNVLLVDGLARVMVLD